MTLRARLALALVAAALLQVLLPAVSGATVSFRCRGVGTRVHSFHVETDWSKKAYRQKENAVVVVTVTRPAHEDPLDNGIPITPPMSMPEEGVRVATQLHTGRYPFPFATGVTDENGEVKLTLSLRSAKPGAYDVSTYVNKYTNQNGPNCTEIEEWGYRYDVRAIRII